jgi:Flp pilus assembly protein TadD
VTHDPRSSVARINLANLLTKAGHHDLAASHLETLLAFAAGDAKGHNNLGIVYAKLGRFDEAITHLERSLELLGPGADSSIPLQMIEALRNAPTIYLENEN